MNDLKIKKVLLTSAYFLLSFIISLIMIINLFFSRTDYACKKYFVFPNLAMFFFFAFIIILLVFILNWLIKHKKETNISFPINLISIILFLVLLYISLNIYFRTGWDAGLVIDQAKQLAEGKNIDGIYFSIFPNQQLLLVLETFLFKVNSAFGVIDTEDGIVVLIMAQCLCVCFTGKLIYDIVYDSSKSVICSFIGYFFFCILHAFSGWVTIPYTDILGIVFPVSILRIYQKMNRESFIMVIVSTMLISLLMYWGIKIKATVVIVAISIVISELVSLLDNYNFRKIKNIIPILAIALLTVFLSNWLFNLIIYKSDVPINNDLSATPIHWAMMGLNEKTNGGWNEEDASFLVKVLNKNDRSIVEKEIFKQRLHDLGIKGLAKHVWKKTLVIFNDGSFAWGDEGDFYSQILKIKNYVSAPLLRNLFYNHGSLFPLLLALEQGAWLIVLFLSSLCIIAKKDRTNLVLVISIIGIILFNLIFEARARYLIVYGPFFIILSMMVFDKLFRFWFDISERIKIK